MNELEQKIRNIIDSLKLPLRKIWVYHEGLTIYFDHDVSGQKLAEFKTDGVSGYEIMIAIKGATDE